MNESLRAVVAAALAVAVGHMNDGCQPYPSREQQYVLDIHACSATAKTQREAKLCRANVNWRYGLCDEPWPAVTPCEEP